MGLLDWLRDALASKESAPNRDGQRPLEVAPPPSPALLGSSYAPSANPDSGFMPKYNGRAICDWVSEVAALKRSGDLSRAQKIANGCMEAMIAAALQSPANVMEFYVAQLVIIQHKQKDYAAEVETIERWLGLELAPTRDDYRLDLQKRLAKAHELLAKQRGEDPSGHHAQWKHFVELEKAKKAEHQGSVLAASTGKSAASGEPACARPRRVPRWVAPDEVLSRPSFVAVDFETANRRGGVSACQIALVRIDAGRVVDKACTYIKPPRGIDHFEFTSIHGISARDVARAPMWPDIAAWVAEFHGGIPVYAHNAPFDAGVWNDLDAFFGTQTFPKDFFCSYRTAQRLVPGLENYRLPTVTSALVPDFKLSHHRADSDAEACALIVAALQSLH